MLRHLHIRDFALICEISLDFAPGMTVLLGETGAGKSIIIDALAAALGERTSADSVRTGAKKCIIEATFDAAAAPWLASPFTEANLDWDDNGIVFRREITSNGTSRCFINDTPVQATVVRQFSSGLMDFHGQHDTHGLLDTSRHREVVDAAAGVRTELRDMTMYWRELVTARDHLHHLRRVADSADAERARLQFLHDEIANIHPVSGEDESVLAELRRAESSEFVISAAVEIRDRLYADDSSVYDILRGVRDRLQSLIPFEPTLEKFISDVESAIVTSKEAASAVASLAEPEEFRPERLEELRLRQLELSRLVRKYGSLDAAISERDKLAAEISGLDSLDESLQEAVVRVEQCLAQATQCAAVLTTARRTAAQPLATSLGVALQKMGMPSAVVDISIVPVEVGPTGADAVEILFSSNAGEPLRPLARIASGGELSRVMLAVKATLAERAETTGTMIFDEIDTGISGRIARHVGEVMMSISTRHQIVCITHLAQIASLADAFVRVTKSESGGVTTVNASTIRGEEAIVEIAKLLSGTDVTDTALVGARELMAHHSESSGKGAVKGRRRSS